MIKIFKWDLTKLVYRGRVIYLFLKKVLMFIKPSFVSFTHGFFTLLGQFQTQLTLNTKILDTLCTFNFPAAHLILLFSCSHLKNMTFFDVKRHVPPIKPERERERERERENDDVGEDEGRRVESSGRGKFGL